MTEWNMLQTDICIGFQPGISKQEGGELGARTASGARSDDGTERLHLGLRPLGGPLLAADAITGDHHPGALGPTLAVHEHLALRIVAQQSQNLHHLFGVRIVVASPGMLMYSMPRLSTSVRSRAIRSSRALRLTTIAIPCALSSAKPLSAGCAPR